MSTDATASRACRRNPVATSEWVSMVTKTFGLTFDALRKANVPIDVFLPFAAPLFIMIMVEVKLDETIQISVLAMSEKKLTLYGEFTNSSSKEI